MFTIKSLSQRIFRKDRPVQAIICKDGFKISVQAGEGIYSSPRGPSTLYSAVELGYPNQSIPAFAEWQESGPDDNTDTVWGYVPITLVVELLNSHGGESENTASEG